MRLKDDMINIFLKEKRELDVEIYSVAHAWVLFERLIYKNVVTKHNRRRYLAACLLISVKLIEFHGGIEANYQKLKNINHDLHEFIKIGDRVTDDKDMLYYEGKVMVALHF